MTTKTASKAASTDDLRTLAEAVLAIAASQTGIAKERAEEVLDSLPKD